MVRDANTGQQLAGGSSSWCPELESRTAHRQVDDGEAGALERREEELACSARPKAQSTHCPPFRLFGCPIGFAGESSADCDSVCPQRLNFAVRPAALLCLRLFLDHSGQRLDRMLLHRA